MRVLYIITGLSTGGAETMLLRLLERLDRNRFELFVISLTTLGDIGQRISALGIPVQALGFTASLSSMMGLLDLVRYIRQLRPDIVHTWLYHADLLGGLAARLAGVPTIVWGIRSSNLDPGKTRWTTRLVRRLCAVLSHMIPDCILLNSETAKRLHVEVGYAGKKMKVVPNGFDVSCFKPNNEARILLRSELGCSSDAQLVGMIGRYDPLKNHVGFFAAMTLVHRCYPQVLFVLAGKDIDRNNSQLMALVEHAGLSNNTHLLGRRDDMATLMAALDVLVCPSDGEAFPNVIGEAMACGVPCVATDVGDCANIIGDSGRIVAAGDMASLAHAVMDLLHLSSVKRSELGEKARARVTALFEINSIVRRYEAVYQSFEGKTQ